jgi:tRNA pseudouridine13 synthase
MPLQRIEPGFVTQASLRTGGELKSEPADFEVEEIPAYEPSGEGEHLYLWIEKRDVTGDDLQARLSRALDCSRSDIGMAGLKDRRAVTRQWISVPAKCEVNVARIDSDDVHLLKAARHRNKLRTGHLHGNRFRIRLRNVSLDSAATAGVIADQLRQTGIPNLYGDQRFGFDESTLTLGLGLLDGSRRSGDIPPSKRRFLLRLALSAVQSALFNNVLVRRLADGLLHSALPGDVMQVTASGGLFVSSDSVADQPRLDGREIVPTGPMFGPEMKLPTEVVAAREDDVLHAAGLSRQTFERFRNLTPGTRRALVIWPNELSVELVGSDLVLRFELPPGAYATAVVREFQKAQTLPEVSENS